MSPLVLLLAVLCGISLIISAPLFLFTSAKRRKIDSVLKRDVSRDESSAAAVRQLGLFNGWPSKLPVALASPERRWTYDQAYMIAFIEVIRSRHVPLMRRAASAASAEIGPSALVYYARVILPLDIGFAVSFAAFIACGALLAGAWLANWPWISRAFVIFAGTGVVYGAADVAEDIKLLRIFAHAERVTASAKTRESRRLGTALADAAEVDAANALTRVKICAIAASIIGLGVFLILAALDGIIAGISGGRVSGGSLTQDDTGSARRFNFPSEVGPQAEA